MRPLEGIRVVELARVLAGPWCGQLLADLGAEVIKVERPHTGDDTRHWGPPFVTLPDGSQGSSAYYQSTNRGKRAVSVDIATLDGQRTVRDLVQAADVLIENYKVGGLARYGLDHASLLAVNPRLVTCSITGFGQDGPYAHRAGYDYIVQGIGGFMSLTGEPDGPPQKAGIAYADIFTGMYGAVAILAALRRRDATGQSAHIDMALLDTQVAVIANQALNWMVSGVVPTRMGSGHANLVPYQTFPTEDGDLIIAVGNDQQFARLCVILGIPQEDSSEFATNAQRVNQRALLVGLLKEKTRCWRKADLAHRLEEQGVPAGPINRLDETFADAQVRAREMRIDRNGIPGVASPIVIDGERMIADLAPPQQP